MVTELPRLYAILDVETLIRRGLGLRSVAQGLRHAGVRLVQLRDKSGSPAEVLERAAVLREELRDCLLIMNDRVDLAVLAGFDGVHVGQEDLRVEDARRVLGSGRTRVVGVSTHTESQVQAADPMSQNRDMGQLEFADYVAIGPVFATGTKLDAAAAVGLDGVRRARVLTRKPLVAIGGITRENCRSVLEAGADSVAVISGLLVEGETVEQVARDFLRILG
jgi:thiamine-phosphate pyrophosphorylase